MRQSMFNGWTVAAMVWMLLIFIGSTDLLASKHTGHIGGIGHRAPFLHYAIRKCGHMTEFAILAILITLAVDRSAYRAGAKNGVHSLWYGFVGASLYAVTDEVHQVFVPSRTGSAVDCLWDVAGAGIGCGLYWSVCHYYRGSIAYALTGRSENV